MTDTRIMRPTARILSTLLATALLPTLAAAQGQVVGPAGASTVGASVAGDATPWQVDRRDGGFAEVTREMGRTGFGDVGEGSLELRVTGAGNTTDGFPEWAFWHRFAGGSEASAIASGGFGRLEDLTSLSFDWYRTAVDGWDDPVGDDPERPINTADWLNKTPVVRLQLAENVGGAITRSELIWEGYYNQASVGVGGRTPVDQWVAQTGMHSNNFWYLRPDGAGQVTFQEWGNCDLGGLSFWSGAPASGSIGALFADGGCFAGADVSVIGISVGVGSAWPLAWRGFADNVRMSFDGTQVLDTNFDFIEETIEVPEPSTLLLTTFGLAALGVAARRRRRA